MDELLTLLTMAQPEMNIVVAEHSVVFQYSPHPEDHLEVEVHKEPVEVIHGVTCIAAWIAFCEGCDAKTIPCIHERIRVLKHLWRALGADRLAEFHQTAIRHVEELPMPCAYYMPRDF